MVDAEVASRVAMALAGLLAALVVWRLDRSGDRRGPPLRSRFLLGVPWGTLVVVALVVAVYLFVQGGLDSLSGPLWLPYVSWSYLYPLGTLLAPFSHQSLNHLTGNLIGTLAFAPVAEYAVGHFPRRRGTSSFGSWWTNPYLRAFLVFPLGVVLVGIGTTLLNPGAVIGFSGVVFAFAGLAVVRYPLTAVAALLAQRLIDLTVDSVLDPVATFTAGQSFSRPPWAEVAYQTHILGFLLGVVVGFAVVGRRDEGPSALRVLLGTAVLGAGISAWTFWWYQGAQRYVLYRGLGLAAVVTLGVLATLAARRWDGEFSMGVSRRTVVALVLLLPVLSMAMAAVPVNLTTVDANADPTTSVTVRDYTVTYEERIVNPKASVFNVSVLNASSRTPTAGVVVMSERRAAWSRVFSPGELAFSGQHFVRVGGVGWERLVYARRQGWSARGGDTAYQVWLRAAGENWTAAFTSRPATADAMLAGKNVSVVPEGGQFFLAVTQNGTALDRVALPRTNQSVRAAGIEFSRAETRVTARVNDTRVPVFTRETYD
jgi:membrane associated rhomboid family serine protease